MSTLVTVLIALGIVLVVGFLVFVIYKWGAKNPVVAGGVLGLLSAVSFYLRGMFKDDPDKLDAHDFMVLFDLLSKVGLEALKLKKEGKPFVEAKELITEKVKEVVETVPAFRNKVPDETVDSIAKVIFDVLGYVPGV